MKREELESKLELLKGNPATLHFYLGEKLISCFDGAFSWYYDEINNEYTFCFDKSFVIVHCRSIKIVSLGMFHIMAVL